MKTFIVQVLDTVDGYPVWQQEVTVPDEPTPHTNFERAVKAGYITGRIQIAEALHIVAPEVCPWDCSHCNDDGDLT